jgi:hypothetical protein
MFSQTQASRDHQSGRLLLTTLSACLVAVAAAGCASRAAPSNAGTSPSKPPAVEAHSTTAIAPTDTPVDAVDPNFAPDETGIPMNPDIPFNPPAPPPASPTPTDNPDAGRTDGVIMLPPPILVGQATQSSLATPSH